MAEVVVDFVWDKLQDAITGPLKDAALKEGEFLWAVSDKVESVNRELGRIRSALKDADARRGGDERARNWVREIRNVAYDIEDSIDKFQAEIDENNHKEPGFLNLVKRGFKKMTSPLYLHTLGADMDAVQAKIKEISASKLNFGADEGSSIKKTASPHILRIKEESVIGFESDKNSIIEKLLDERISRRAVVSIVGPGGIGKSTLTQTVFESKEVEKHFEVHIWLDVSQEFNYIDLFKKMARKLEINTNQSEEDLIAKVHESMKEKKYIVVLDDIWTKEAWDQLNYALSEGQNGSRVLVTCRNFNIARAIDPRSEPHGLQFLSEEESLELLLQKALPQIDSDEGRRRDLVELAEQFARKCEGLPLQLVVLGGLLSMKPRDYNAWNRAMQTLDWSVDGKRCLDIIQSSYEDLPSHLKSCFMSFSAFPEDYKIDVGSLISYWIVEGFTTRDKAHTYLEELVQRCMVQVVKQNSHTSLFETIRVHELLRNLAIVEAKEKDFITIFRKQDCQNPATTKARHASFHLYTSEKDDNFEGKDVIEYTGENVRSLMFFGKFLPIKSKLKLLKVLIVYRADVSFYYDGKHCWLDKLIGLRHLEFRDCRIENNLLPESIEHLYNLKYLDLTDTYVSNIPKLPEFNERVEVRVNVTENRS